MEDESKGLNALKFSGKKEDFVQWQQRFLAYAYFKEFKDVLLQKQTLIVPPAGGVLTPEQVKSNQVFHKANAQAYSVLHLLIKDSVGFGILYNAMTPEYPEGDAAKAWEGLIKVFKPVNSSKKYELEQHFQKSSLEREQMNPDEWFSILENIRLQLWIDYNMKIDDERMISQIINNIHPVQYKTTLTVIKRDLNKGVAITLEELKEELRQVYGTIKAQKIKGETALAGAGKNKRFKKQFKGQCNNCSEYGHKAVDCPKRGNNPKQQKKPPALPKAGDIAHLVNADDGKDPCSYCDKPGHTIKDCWRIHGKPKNSKPKKTIDTSTKKPPNSSEAGKGTGTDKAAMLFIAVTKKEVDLLLSTSTGSTSLTKNTFIADSGATCHMRNSMAGMYDVEEHTQAITVGNSERMYSKFRGKFKGTIIQQDGQYIDIILDDVLYVPDLWINLFSITKVLISPNVELGNNGQLITLHFKEQEYTLTFDKILNAGQGHLQGVEINPSEDYATMMMLTNALIIYEDMHEKLGHPNVQVVRHTAKHYGIQPKDIDEEPETCRFCATAKHKRTPIPKFTENKEYEVGERINIDISYVKNASFGGARFWLLIQDERTDHIWSIFLRHKNETADKMIEWLHMIKNTMDITVCIIRCDNAGENRKLQEIVNADPDLKIKFEFTAPSTPQQNGKIERKFQTLYGKVRAMLNWARLTTHLRTRLWAQCAAVATKLENIIVKGHDDITAHEKFYGVTPTLINHLRTFGEIAIVHDGKKIRGKLTNHGIPCMFIGYPDDHSPDVYQFLNLETEMVIMSRNYVWLNKSYGEYRNLEVEIINEPLTTPDLEDYEIVDEPDVFDVGVYHENPNQVNNEEEQSVIEIENEESSEDDLEDEHGSGNEMITKTRISGVNRALKNLQTYFNPDPWEHMEDSAGVVFINTGESLMVANIHDGNPEPKNIHEARQTKEWSKWWEACCTEFQNMEDKGVWEVVNRKDLPPGRKVIGNRWVFAVKDDGRYRARTVAKGYSQVPGKDFQENFAPVVNDATFHLILVLTFLMGLQVEQFDIETAFLYGELDEEIWMEFPDGYPEFIHEKWQYAQPPEPKPELITNPKAFCLRLKKALYGLVQAARQWWKKFKKVMKSIGFLPSEIDPCLFIKDKGNGLKAFVIIYVDDGGIFGTEEDIKETIEALTKSFVVKDLGKLEYFVGCRIIRDPHNKNRAFIHQPKLLEHLRKEFKHLGKIRDFKTPAGPKTTIIRPVKEDKLITKKEQTIYRSGVGMLLYLVKHSRPEISNAVRELSKVCDGATYGHWKCLLRTIQYVLSTKSNGLKIQPTIMDGTYVLEAVSDSEYAGDKDTRISVYGYVIYFNGSPVVWKSKSGRAVTLSSTEAEYYAISECAKELIFLKHVIESMGIQLKLPIVIKTDNVGAIYLSNNYTTSQRTKHIDVRVHFVRQYIEDGIFRIEFVGSEDNDADIFTKNTSEEIFNKQSVKLIANTGSHK
jgi:hypothetical protein